jgi:hypothetical protein
MAKRSSRTETTAKAGAKKLDAAIAAKIKEMGF